METKKKREKIINYSLIVILLIIFFIPDVKVLVQQGMMKLGLFQPKLEKVEPSQTEQNQISMSFKNAQGEVVDLQSLEGKVVFINFWATWCPPCRAEMPTIQSLYNQFKNDDEVVFVLLEVDGNQMKAEKIMKDKQWNLPVYYSNSAIPSYFFQGTLPTTVILDKNGNKVHQTQGMADYSGQKMIDFLNSLKS
ncbi:TlpA disulfide reductase family protein [Elizabethkingia sp. JS20170427COW]|uniref:TlpA family protein disulfide reductase n=1 Tax=Elizabethkingia sp. JS20170427COW TaxID=2583851 RepID=UPI001110348C|nr:TlpA disulfide reductase family protein [Elizabethkingia sp. JS20170427COW]QCX54310.1 TlpA family protein disulfide reductase [Elizabethkingia sp. JS20170427COW]